MHAAKQLRLIMTLDDIALSVRKFLIDHKGEIDLPFLWDFPNGCCETASFLLSECILLLYPDTDVFIVKSYLHPGIHIWVEVDKLIYDITLDQYSEFDGIVIGVESSVEHIQYKDIEKILYPSEKLQNAWFPSKDEAFQNAAKKFLNR